MSYPPTTLELLLLSDFGRANPLRAREIADLAMRRGSQRNEPVRVPIEPKPVEPEPCLPTT